MNTAYVFLFFANALMLLAKGILAGAVSPVIIQFFKKVVFVKVKSFIWKWIIALVISILAGCIVAWSQGVFKDWTATMTDYGLLSVALASTWGFCQFFWKTTFEPLFSSMTELSTKR